MKESIQQIEQWAEERNLIQGSTPEKQFLKLMEEFGELCGGIAKDKPEIIKDSIGDCFVVLVILNKQLKTDVNISSIIEEILPLLVLTDGEPVTSTMIFASRAGNLADSLGYETDSKLSIGCLFGALAMISFKYNLNLMDCIQHAYNQIKDRKGKMIDGVFVKEEDL